MRLIIFICGVLVAQAAAYVEDDLLDPCDIDSCVCTIVIHPKWKRLTCKLGYDRKLVSERVLIAAHRCRRYPSHAKRPQFSLMKLALGGTVVLVTLSPRHRHYRSHEKRPQIFLMKLATGGMVVTLSPRRRHYRSHAKRPQCIVTKLIFNTKYNVTHLVDIDINGGNEIVFESDSLFYGNSLRYIAVSNASEVSFHSKSINEFGSASLRIEIVKSMRVHFDSLTMGTSRRMIYNPADKTTNNTGHQYVGISLLLDRVHEVLMASHVFSNIVDINMTVINSLRLGEAALQMDPKSFVSHHGPELILEFNEVSVGVLPKDTFASSAARVALRNVRIEEIAAEAFSATKINELVLENSVIGTIHSAAFNNALLIEHLVVNHSVIGLVRENAINAGINTFIMNANQIKRLESRAIEVSAANVNFEENDFDLCVNDSIAFNNFSNLTVNQNHFIIAQRPIIKLQPATDGQKPTFMFTGNHIIDLEIDNPATALYTNHTWLKIKAYNNTLGTCHCHMDKWMTTSNELSRNYCKTTTFNCTSLVTTVKTVRLYEFLNTCKDIPIKTCNTVATAVNTPSSTNYMDIIPIGIAVVAIIFFFLVFCLMCKSKNRRRAVKDTCKRLFLLRFCINRADCQMETEVSISQLTIPHDYTEMQSITTPQKEHELPQTYADVYTADKATQSLPEELTKEFLESLKDRLADPESYADAKAVVDHLYELVKAEETCNTEIIREDDENIYDLPLPPPVKRINRMKKECVTVGTDSPSLEKLLPFSPYDRQTGLCHEYFEPRDLAVHVYAEIGNYKGNALKSNVPDVLGQAMPRGPFLRALQQKNLLEPTSTVKSNGSTASDVSVKMMNRPLPAEPGYIDPGEGTSAYLNRE